jgi:hypothetical protein
VALLGELRAKGVDLYLHQQGLDTSTPAGKANLPGEDRRPAVALCDRQGEGA